MDTALPLRKKRYCKTARPADDSRMMIAPSSPPLDLIRSQLNTKLSRPKHHYPVFSTAGPSPLLVFPRCMVASQQYDSSSRKAEGRRLTGQTAPRTLRIQPDSIASRPLNQVVPEERSCAVPKG